MNYKTFGFELFIRQKQQIQEVLNMLFFLNFFLTFNRPNDQSIKQENNCQINQKMYIIVSCSPVLYVMFENHVFWQLVEYFFILTTTILLVNYGDFL